MVESNIPPAQSNYNGPERRKDNTPRWKKRIEIGALIIAMLLLVINAFVGWGTWRAACAANDSLRIQIQGMRLQYAAKVSMNKHMGWNNLGPGQTADVTLMIQNKEGIPAERTTITAQLEFRKFAPEVSVRNFTVGDPISVTSVGTQDQIGVLYPLHPESGDNAAYIHIRVKNPTEYVSYRSKDANLFVWGTVHFKDGLNESPDPIYFCRYISATPETIETKPDLGGWKGGYQGHYYECPHP